MFTFTRKAGTKGASAKGFSLVELMVVVAIIGILAAVAIPNFQRFQRKSRQAEGKSALGSIHQAETVFFQSYDTYFSDLLEINVPTPVGTIFYNAGFSANQTGAVLVARIGANLYPKDPGIVSQAAFEFLTPAFCGGQCVLAPVGQAGRAGLGAGITDGAMVVSDTMGNLATFRAEARAWIGGVAEDVWNIDQTKTMMQTLDGVQ
jgi:prepilin-type N-terminal cleavage/methylation domain-containing protein